jgi:hypothetical protein
MTQRNIDRLLTRDLGRQEDAVLQGERQAYPSKRCYAPAPEAIRRVADRNELPVDRITDVRVLDPYFSR